MPYRNIVTELYIFKNFQIIPLPKCGSTSIRHGGFLSVKNVTSNFEPLVDESKKTYVCIRHPQHRFPSAIKEALYRKDKDTILETEMRDILVNIESKEDPKPDLYELLEYIKSTKIDFTKHIMENHLAPLWSYFHTMPKHVLDHLHFFDMSDLSKLYEQHTGKKLKIESGGKSTSGHGGYEKWTNIIQSDQKLIDLIDETYAEDYNLFNRIQKI